MGKGRRRERLADELYSDAGYETFRPPRSKFGETDMFGLFDLLAIQPDAKPRLVQVKANTAKGIQQWFEDAEATTPREHVELDFLVCTDYKGWRVMRPHDEHNYTTVVDERDESCQMGDLVVRFLREEQGAEYVDV